LPLDFVKPSAAEPTQNILLYGGPGTGKSTGAASAPGPILYGNAEGPGALRFARKTYGDEKFHEVRIAKKADLDAIYLHAREEKAPERTVVIDSVGEVYRVLLEEIGGDRPTIQNWGDVNTMIERFARAMRDIDRNVVFICHEEIVRDEQTGEMLRQPITGGRKLPAILMAMVDVVAYTGVVPATDDSPAKFLGQLVAGGGRHGKDRSGALGAVRPLDLSEWIATAAEATTTTTTPKRRAA
jgi:hypothetical protein